MAKVSAAEVARCHDEVLAALTQLAADTGVSSARGEQVRIDRGSSLEHIGLRTPDRRKRVAAGFSFSDGSPADVLAIWDGVWRHANNGDVLFAALDTYRTPGIHNANDAFWHTVIGWIERIDNWAHADDLARICSFVLEAQTDAVYPVLESWSSSDSEWHKRVSIVSLIHYSGKNAVFMPVEPVLHLVKNCVDDDRESVYKAVGWLLRETMAKYPDEVVDFLRTNAPLMHAHAIRRATEKLPTNERDRLRAELRSGR